MRNGCVKPCLMHVSAYTSGATELVRKLLCDDVDQKYNSSRCTMLSSSLTGTINSGVVTGVLLGLFEMVVPVGVLASFDAEGDAVWLPGYGFSAS